MGRKRSVKSKRDFNPADDSTLVLTMCSIVGCGHSEHAVIVPIYLIKIPKIILHLG